MKAWPALSVIRHHEPDYGASMRAGFLAATAEWVANFDIDYFSGPFRLCSANIPRQTS